MEISEGPSLKKSIYLHLFSLKKNPNGLPCHVFGGFLHDAIVICAFHFENKTWNLPQEHGSWCNDAKQGKFMLTQFMQKVIYFS